MENKQVIKRGMATEPYQADKIKNVTQAAGLKPEQATSVAEQITSWINSLSQNTINSEDIRNRVITELQKIDPYVAGLFQWYEKNK